MGKLTYTTTHPIFKSALVAMLVSHIQKAGQKSVAERLIFKTMQFIEQKTGKPALIVLEIAVRKLMPESSLVSQRIGASVYPIPRPILITKSIPVAIKWIVAAAKSKKSKTIYEAIGLEIIDAFNGQGMSIAKLQQNRRMATANLVFARFDKGMRRRINRVGRKIFKSRDGAKQRRSITKLFKVKKPNYSRRAHRVQAANDYKLGAMDDYVWHANW